MITLLSTLIGFLASGLPEVFKFFRERADRAHELAVLGLQIQSQERIGAQRIEEVRIAGEAQALVAETNRLAASMRPSGVKWVDGLGGTVRPVITYAFFALYAAIKAAQWNNGVPLAGLWTEDDQALWSSIVAFWFGQRAFSKMRGGK